MDYFSTVHGQNVMDNISYQLTRIANALEALATANAKPVNEEKEKKA